MWKEVKAYLIGAFWLSVVLGFYVLVFMANTFRWGPGA